MKQRKTIATNIIIAICFGVWVFIQLFPSDSTITNAILIGAFYKPFVLAGILASIDSRFCPCSSMAFSYEHDGIIITWQNL